MAIADETGTQVEAADVSGEVLDPEVGPEAERFIGEVDRLARGVEASAQGADEARRLAEQAKTKSAGFGQKQAAIQSLQDAGVAASGAISALAESQKHLFENQQTLAKSLVDLKDYALGSIAATRLVYRHLQLKLSDASERELSELAQSELRQVMQEFKRQLDLAERQEQADKKLVLLRDELSRQKAQAEQAISVADEEHKLFHQAAALAKSNAVRLDAFLEDLELQREADRVFNESMQVVSRRLDEVELLSASTASSLATEGVHGERRDESIAQLYALAASHQEAAQRSDTALAATTQSTTETVRRLQRRLGIAVAVAVTAVVLSLTALVLSLLT